MQNSKSKSNKQWQNIFFYYNLNENLELLSLKGDKN